MISKAMEKVIGYIRVSTNHQDLERQKVLIKKYCDENGFTLIRLIEDFGISGADRERAGYLELQALTEQSCDMIVVSELARLSRDEDVMNTLNTIYALMAKFDLVMLDDLATIYKKGAKFDFIQFMSLAFKAYGAAEERKKIAERMKTGKYAHIAKYPLACLGSTEPLGFKKVPNPKYDERTNGEPQYLYEVDAKEAEIVKDIFRWAAEGVSTHKIADKLHSLGISSQTGVQIGHSYIRFILNNPVYKGIRIYKGEEYYTGVEFVSQELWAQAQLSLKENKTRADKYTTHCNPVKGILKCACGCNMQIVLSGKTKHYGCVARVHKKQVRNVEPDTRFYGINYEDLNAILWQEVKYRILRTEYQAKSNEKIDALNAEIYRFVESIEARQNEIVARENDKATIINNMALIKHPSALIALESKLNELDAEIADIEKSIKATEKEIAKNQRRISDENKTQSIKELQEMTLEGKGEIFKNMLEKVVWVSEKTRRGFLIVTYKNGVEVIWLYKNVRGTRVAINLPSTFRYNPETYKVEVTLTKRNPNIKFDFGEEVIEEYTPDEMLKSFDFIGNEEYDASASVWED